MRGKLLVLLFVVPLAIAHAATAFAQNTVGRVIAIQDAQLDENNVGGSNVGNNGNSQPMQIHRGQLLTAYNRDGNRVYVVRDALANSRQRTWGWVNAEAVMPLDQATKHFNDCLKKDPKDIGAYLGRASAASALGQNDRVIADCDELLRIDAKSASGHYLRGSAWLASGKDDKAIADFSEVVQLDPGRADAFRLRADLWRKQKNYPGAIADYTRLLKLSPNEVNAYYSRALARFENKEYRKAINDLNEILSMQPEVSSAYNLRGLIWERLREYDKAEDDLAEVLRLHRLQAAQWTNQIWNCFEQGQTSACWYYGTEFLKAYNQCAEDLATLADCHAAQGELQKALDDCEEALRIDPASPRAHQLRGVYLAQRKQFARAMADFDTALRLNPKFATLHHMLRGGCRADLGQFDAALADFEEALRSEPDNAEACNNVAWFLATCEDPRYRDGKRAIVLATKACQAGAWESSGTIDTLAAAYAEAGDFDNAVRWQQKALALATPASMKEMTDRLALYKARKPYREPVKVDAGASTLAGAKKGA